jgi:4-hydroxybenzoate polyprenyltransferase
VTASSDASLPLCVDLDGTLLSSDTLFETLLVCAKRRPWWLLLLPFWLMRGRPHLKRRLAEVAPIAPGDLPFREEVVAYLREARAAGRPVLLATAAHARVSAGVIEALPIFDDVIATSATDNVKGARKAELLVERFGERGFEYVGDSRADWAVWRTAARGSSVGLSASARGRLENLAPGGRHFDAPEAGPGSWVRALRIHQWVKNGLLFLPLLASHRFTEIEPLLATLVGFLAFGALASSVYVLNDLLDLAADRRHPTKRNRPFASGELPIASGLLVAPLLVAASFTLASQLPPAFTVILCTYLALNALYTLVLKRVVIADVVLLSVLYGLRVLAGGFACGIVVSPWLMGFSLFFFMNLAFLKRYADLRLLAQAGETAAEGRDYHVEDAPLLLGLGPASGYLATVVLALYVQSDAVGKLYGTPEVLWGLVPLLVYWTSRFWMLAHRGQVADDPIISTVRDPASYGVLALAVVVFAIGALI